MLALKLVSEADRWEVITFSIFNTVWCHNLMVQVTAKFSCIVPSDSPWCNVISYLRATLHCFRTIIFAEEQMRAAKRTCIFLRLQPF